MLTKHHRSTAWYVSLTRECGTIFEEFIKASRDALLRAVVCRRANKADVPLRHGYALRYSTGESWDAVESRN